ncbi:MAG: asparagine synthase-related protein [Terriglobia bacterium]
MPGIVGLIAQWPRERAEAELRRMIAAMSHEPSNVSGTWCDESIGIYAGWVAHRGSFAGSMPQHNERGDLSLVFSGEEYSDSERAANLSARGHAVDLEGPSYLVHLAEEERDFPKSLNGRFHGVVADRVASTATLFNDRYGMHRIYFHEADGAFYFAAEAKAILAVRPELRSIDPDGLAQLVSCGCTLKNRTVFKGIQVLPPASAWTFRQAAVERRSSYFDPEEWEAQSPLEPEAYYRQLREVFSGILPRYFGGSRPIGVSLTGGLDTRMIMSWQRAAPGSLPCYSFGGMFRDSEDVRIARRVARACGQEFEVIRVGNDFLAQFPHYSERAVFLTDGCVDVKHSSDLYVNERAAKIAPVRMTGNYGGEVLRRVRAFKPVDAAPGLFNPDFCTYLERAKETYSGIANGHPLSFAVFRQAPWHHYSLLCLEQSQLTLRSPFLDNEFVRTVFRAPPQALTSDGISLRLIADGDPKLRRIRTDRGLAGTFPAWAAAMQREYLEFIFKAEYAYDYGMPQSVARVDRALKPLHLERLFLGRHKFYHYRLWYRDALAGYIREMLLDPRTLSRPYLNRRVLEDVVEGHLSGKRNYTTTLHKVLTLEHLHRLFIDSI